MNFWNVIWLCPSMLQSSAYIRPQQDRRQQQQEAKRAARKEAAAAAKAQLQTIKPNSSKRICNKEEHGQVKLPLDVLQQVLACLAHIEADGVRGPSMAARDLASAALTSRELCHASKHAFAVLAAQAAELQLVRSEEATMCTRFTAPANAQGSIKTVTQLQCLPDPNGWSWQQWAALLQDPLRFKLAELKQAARQLEVLVSGTKPQLVLRILAAFGLQQPSSVSPQLLRAVLLERCCVRPWVGCELVNSTWSELRACGRSEVDRKWPGLREMLCSGHATAAAHQRAALHKYTGACSRQELLQLRNQAEEWQAHMRRVDEEEERMAEQYNEIVAVLADGAAAALRGALYECDEDEPLDGPWGYTNRYW